MFKKSAYQLFRFFVNLIMLLLPTYFLRRIFVKILGADISRNVNFERGVKFEFPWRLSINEGTTINSGVYLDCRGGSIIIDKNVDISTDSFIYTLTHDIYSDTFNVKYANVHIHSKCWIGARTVILPGSNIKTGSVIGANSVVRGQIEEYELWLGVPACFIKKLPSHRSTNR